MVNLVSLCVEVLELTLQCLLHFLVIIDTRENIISACLWEPTKLKNWSTIHVYCFDDLNIGHGVLGFKWVYIVIKLYNLLMT